MCVCVCSESAGCQWEEGGCVCGALMQHHRPDSCVYVPPVLKWGDEAQGTKVGGHKVPPSTHTHRSDIKAAELTRFSSSGSR